MLLKNIKKMKVFQVLLVLFLVASLECKKDIVSEISCFISQPDMLPSLQRVYELIKNKEKGFIIGLYIASMYDKVKKGVEKCFK